MRFPSAIVVFSVAVAVTLAGCAGRLPTTHYYVLEPSDLPAASPQVGGLSIGVRTFRVDPPYDQDRIVYRVGRDSAEVGFYAYHRWAAPLERMLPRVVAASFADMPGTKSIEPAVSGRSYDAYLDGRVLAFEESDTTEGQRVRVQLHLSLRVNDEDEVWSQTVTGHDSISTKDVGQIVESLRSALDAALRSAHPAI